jgi:hypothetical protein
MKRVGMVDANRAQPQAMTAARRAGDRGEKRAGRVPVKPKCLAIAFHVTAAISPQRHGELMRASWTFDPVDSLALARHRKVVTKPL